LRSIDEIIIIIAHRAEITPRDREGPATRQERRARDMLPLRRRLATIVAEAPGALVDDRRSDDRREVKIQQTRTVEAQRNAAVIAERHGERIGKTHVDAVGLQTARVEV